MYFLSWQCSKFYLRALCSPFCIRFSYKPNFKFTPNLKLNSYIWSIVSMPRKLVTFEHRWSDPELLSFTINGILSKRHRVWEAKLKRIPYLKCNSYIRPIVKDSGIMLGSLCRSISDWLHMLYFTSDRSANHGVVIGILGSFPLKLSDLHDQLGIPYQRWSIKKSFIFDTVHSLRKALSVWSFWLFLLLCVASFQDMGDQGYPQYSISSCSSQCFAIC